MVGKKISSNMFLEEMENEAIKRIQKFAKIADLMGYEIGVGFSGGKDSLVVYDLCKRAGIDCKFFFNHALEDKKTLQYIREYFPDVIWRREASGFFKSLQVKKVLPTVSIAWCCETYKHPPKNTDDAVILGVRASESLKRKDRKVFETKNKTFRKRNKATFDEYFEDRCQGVGSPNKISLKPIVDWNEKDVWEYIQKYNLSINPLYKEGFNRIGCMICPKCSFERNYKMLMRYPKLVDSTINAITKWGGYDWYLKTDDKCYLNDKVYYVCRWLNHSFMPFSKKQEVLYKQFREYYDSLKKQQ